jgi:DNA-binding NarL/FixJ family response regulator
METASFRTTQKALNDVARHASAKHVYILKRRHQEGFDLTLCDDGERARRNAPGRAEFAENRILIVSMHADEAYVQSALEAGAAGCLLNGAAKDDLELALRVVLPPGTVAALQGI